MAIHSAVKAYAPEGSYGDKDRPKRSMDIRPSREAEATHLHPLIRKHPETGREGLFSCFGYIIGIEGMPETESTPLLLDLYQWQSRPKFQYRHRWRPNMLLMWDNRCTMHRRDAFDPATRRLLVRTQISGEPVAGLAQ